MNKKLERQLRWNALSKDHPEMHEYYILLINTPSEARRIQQRISEHLAPAEEPVILADVSVQKSRGLHWRLMQVSSYGVSPITVNFASVYGGKIYRDRNLSSRQSSDGLVGYVARCVEKRDFG